jgi:hypothetical protein
MSNDPETMLSAYVKAFASLDPEAVVPFYLLPCTFISPGGVWVVSDDEAALTLAAHMIDHARQQGARSRAGRNPCPCSGS